MLIYGTAETLNMSALDRSNTIVVNFTSLFQSGNIPTLNKLMPPSQVYFDEERTFDIAYMQYILSNNDVFCTFFELINTINFYPNTLILIGEYNSALVSLNESLQMLIAERYGIPIYRVATNEDLTSLILHTEDLGMSIQGVYNFDQDMDRYQLIRQEEYVKQEIAAGKVFDNESGSFVSME